jgi:hypothetical protein
MNGIYQAMPEFDERGVVLGGAAPRIAGRIALVSDLDESSAIRAYLSLTFQFLCAVPSTTQFVESGIALGSLKCPHLIRVLFELPNQFLKPCVTDPQLSSPVAAGWLVSVATFVPPECKSPDQFRLFFTAPRTGQMPSRAVDCFQQISDGDFTWWHRSSFPLL